MNKAFVTIILATLSISVYAGNAYTPGELNQMINSGNYPKQGPVSNTTTKPMSFSTCKIATENVMSQIRDYYPVETIVNTSTMQMVKAWTNDGAITVTCSAPDQKFVFTQAPYR